MSPALGRELAPLELTQKIKSINEISINSRQPSQTTEVALMITATKMSSKGFWS